MSESHDQERSPQDAAPYRFEKPGSIRALAHPARLAIIDALAGGDELTATQCAELTGLSPSATAYHLKFLARYGAVEAAPQGPDRRERPWRTAGRQLRADLDVSTPASAAAAAAVAAAHIGATRTIMVEFNEGADAEPEEWRNAVLNNADLWLTAEEFRRVAKELAAVLEPYRARTPHGGRPAGSRLIRVMNVVVPRRRAHPETRARQA